MNGNFKRVQSGNEKFDEILHGGFPANSINLIMGQPGTGKTVFAQSVVFHNSTADRPTVYLTTLSEPVSKVVTYLQLFSFFDESKIGSTIRYLDIGAELAKDGIWAIIPRVKDLIRTVAPKVIVIDSFKALHDLAESPQDMRRMLFELTGMLSAFETTAFFVGEYTDEEARVLPEFAIADSIVQLLRSAQSTRDERFLRVLKLRGSGYIEGLHGFRISKNGLEVFPRLISPLVAETYTLGVERLESGIPGMDALIGGGLLRGSTTLLVGSTGSGKTTFGLQFAMAALRRNEPCLVVNFQENPYQLAQSLNRLGGIKMEQAKTQGLELIYKSPVEMQIDELIGSMFQLIQEKNIRRVVIDSACEIARSATDAQRFHHYMYALIQHLAARGITSVITFETTGGTTHDVVSNALEEPFSYLSDNIILLSWNSSSDTGRELVCLKARGSEHDLRPHPLIITKEGLCVEKKLACDRAAREPVQATIAK